MGVETASVLLFGVGSPCAEEPFNASDNLALFDPPPFPPWLFCENDDPTIGTVSVVIGEGAGWIIESGYCRSAAGSGASRNSMLTPSSLVVTTSNPTHIWCAPLGGRPIVADGSLQVGVPLVYSC